MCSMKLAPIFVRPFEIIKKVGPVAYRLDFPEELNSVHDTFHPVEILEREFKKLKRSRIAIVKVRWNSKRGPEFTWEREDQMKLKYPHLFSDTREEHEENLGLVLELLKKERLYAKFCKCEFGLREVQFLGHVINGDVIYVDPSKIETVKNWEAPRTPSEVRSFLGLAGKTYDWGEDQENAFQTLKDKLCNARVLALLDGPKDFVVYCDASGLRLGCVLMQRGKVIAYASRTKSVIYTDHKSLQHIFSQKELKRFLVIMTAKFATIPSSIKDKILASQKEASDESAGLQRGIDEMIKLRSDGSLYYLDRIWVPLKGDVRTLIMNEAHKSKYSVHPRADKMYYDLRDSSGHDTIWVIVDRLTKSAHFLPMREDYKMDRLVRLYLNEIVARHGVPISIISDRDSRFTSRFWQSMQEALGTWLDMSTAYHPQTDGQSERTI
ncbi:putative reverse transcriptase domain-containing protein [Tanacetum coccineum]